MNTNQGCIQLPPTLDSDFAEAHPEHDTNSDNSAASTWTDWSLVLIPLEATLEPAPLIPVTPLAFMPKLDVEQAGIHQGPPAACGG